MSPNPVVRIDAILAVELLLVALLVGYGSFSLQRLGLLLLLASASMALRGRSWAAAGLRRPHAVSETLLVAVAATVFVLLALRIVIAPSAVWATGVPIDHSALLAPGDTRGLLSWLATAWTLAAFAEEMVFRGYLLARIGDLFRNSRTSSLVGLAVSSTLFGLAHRYQGAAGVLATGTIGALLGAVYLATRRNLWTVILCHGLVDTAALVAFYFDRRAWLFP